MEFVTSSQVPALTGGYYTIRRPKEDGTVEITHKSTAITPEERIEQDRQDYIRNIRSIEQRIQLFDAGELFSPYEVKTLSIRGELDSYRASLEAELADQQAKLAALEPVVAKRGRR